MTKFYIWRQEPTTTVTTPTLSKDLTLKTHYIHRHPVPTFSPSTLFLPSPFRLCPVSLNRLLTPSGPHPGPWVPVSTSDHIRKVLSPFPPFSLWFPVSFRRSVSVDPFDLSPTFPLYSVSQVPQSSGHSSNCGPSVPVVPVSFHLYTFEFGYPSRVLLMSVSFSLPGSLVVTFTGPVDSVRRNGIRIPKTLRSLPSLVKNLSVTNGMLHWLSHTYCVYGCRSSF